MGELISRLSCVVVRKEYHWRQFYSGMADQGKREGVPEASGNRESVIILYTDRKPAVVETAREGHPQAGTKLGDVLRAPIGALQSAIAAVRQRFGRGPRRYSRYSFQQLDANSGPQGAVMIVEGREPGEIIIMARAAAALRARHTSIIVLPTKVEIDRFGVDDSTRKILAKVKTIVPLLILLVGLTTVLTHLRHENPLTSVRELERALFSMLLTTLLLVIWLFQRRRDS